MKLIPNHTENVSAENTLQRLVDKLAEGALATVTRKKSFIVNDVPAELVITTDENMLATVLGELLHSVVINAENSCIRIAAKVYGNIVLVHVKDTSKADDHLITHRLDKMQPLAEKIGGCMTVCNRQEKVITVAFSFLNLPKAA